MALSSGGEVEKEALVSALHDLCSTQETLLSNVKDAVKESVEQFIERKISKLFGLASAYKKILERLEVHTKDDLQKKVKRHFRYSEVREAYDDWHELEEEFHALGARLLLVSFGVREGAELWLRDTKCPFPMVLDGHRKLYQLFGLKRSVFKVWSVSCLVYYGEQMRANKPLPSPYENVHDDVNQMGGDFIVSEEGKLILCHCSQTSNDRPTADALLQALQKL